MKSLFKLFLLTSFLSPGLLPSAAFAQQAEDGDQSQPASQPQVASSLSDGAASVAVGMPDVPDIAVPWPNLDAFQTSEQDAQRRQGMRWDNLKYNIEIVGLKAVGLEDRFKELSTLISERRDSATGAQINRRAEADVKTITQLLNSYGYYDSTTDVAIAPVGADDPGRVTVTLKVDVGPRYTFSEINLTLPEGTSTPTRNLVEELFPLRVGEYIIASEVESAEGELRLKLPQRGYPFAELGTRQVLLDDLQNTGIYTLPVTPGPIGVFGNFRTKGDLLFSQRHLRVLSRFRPGDPYDSRDVEDLRQALVATGLYSSVALHPVETGEYAPDGRAVVDVEVETSKGPQRQLAASGGYSTGEGFRVEGQWMHRNLLPPEGAVIFRAVAGTREQRLGADLRRSNAGKRGRFVYAAVDASSENREAYNAQALTVSAALHRAPDVLLGRRWGYSLGSELVVTNQRDRSLFADEGVENGKRRTFIIGALPGVLQYDGSNSLLNPTHGFRVAGRVTPEAAFQDGIFGYTRFRIDASGYLPFNNDNIVLAGRIALGSIVGAARDRIAPSRRFYAGGGGSVRGYGYEELGPKDADGDPLGGRSLTEVSTELRYRFGDYGIVAFVDGGEVYTEKLPQFSRLRFGVGLGARYYTDFGPLRFDVATPVDRRPGDPKFAVYISIGQAF